MFTPLSCDSIVAGFLAVVGNEDLLHPAIPPGARPTLRVGSRGSSSMVPRHCRGRQVRSIMSAGPNVGSDHRPVVADLALGIAVQKDLEDHIKTYGVKAVFVGSTVNPALAQRVADDTGVKARSRLPADGPAAVRISDSRWPAW